MKKIIIFLLIGITSVVAGHEFWFLPQKFFFRIREVANLRFMVGEDMRGDNWGGNSDKVKQLFHYTPAGNIFDLSSKISSNKGDSLQLPLQEEGTHMVVFNSTNSFISLEAAKFNEYLKEDGLDNAISYRKEKKEEDKKSTEHYQRSIKTLLQVGTKLTGACETPTSLPLDIIPEENPYTVQVGNRENILRVRFRVLYNSEPLANALVKTWYRIPGKGIKMDSARTNKRGWVTADRHPGYFMVSCVHMVHTPEDKEAEWQSYWSSVTFEYPQFFPGSSTR